MKKMFKKFSVLLAIVFLFQCAGSSFFQFKVFAATTVYEAENGNLSGVAQSYGSYVGNLGKDTSGNLGSLSLQISAPTNGVYNFAILYRSYIDKNLWIGVNNKSCFAGNFTSGSWITKNCKVFLKSGTNTVVFYNEKGSAPDIDKITVSSLLNTSDTPTVPTEVSASYSGNGTVISWNESLVGVLNAPVIYTVYRNGAKVGITSYTSYSQPNLPAGTYNYSVTATCYGKTSPNSANASVTVGGTPIIKNADFEMNNTNWTNIPGNSTTVIKHEAGKGVNGTNCFSISSTTRANSALVQKITLEPNKLYVLYAYVKAENLKVYEWNQVGPSISINNTWTNTESSTFFNNYDWKQIMMNFQAPADGVVEIACRLGYWYNTSTGKAYFDNIVIVPDTSVERKDGCCVYMNLEKTDIQGFSDANYSKWLSRLDSVYAKYYELVGYLPNNGDKIGILSVHQDPYGWAVEGNPILWHQVHVKNELYNITAHDSWSFGIMHEMSHVFDIRYAGDKCGWNFDGEFWANTKMYYALEQLNGKVYMDNTVYTGSELTNFYSSKYMSAMGKAENRVYNNDSLTFCFIRMKECWKNYYSDPWKPMKDTFIEFRTKGYNPSTNLEKFDLFIKTLQSHNTSPVSVENTFEPGELEIIRTHLRNNP